MSQPITPEQAAVIESRFFNDGNVDIDEIAEDLGVPVEEAKYVITRLNPEALEEE